ncbi:4-hydroxybenzoate polyprenyltransferase [Streptomyces sp. SAI-170]|uniref:UbiA family prenyltransferase n=1 Tax=Streptomyces sp. SAI-170 TaxID=3377729 RepID=UPI003C7C283F
MTLPLDKPVPSPAAQTGTPQTVACLARAVRFSRTEASVSWRMLADNVLVNVVPPLVFAFGACLRNEVSARHTLGNLGAVGVLAFLYGYVFDASNQARGAEEDRLNKPYRPVPAGLITPAGAAHRFWLVMPLYTLLGWQCGVLEWVLLWQADVLVLNFLCTPRAYLWCKTPCMVVGTAAQLAAAWQCVAPLDGTAITWIAVIALAYPLALIYKDVRDMAGDQAAGRRTPALVCGAWAVRIWFSGIQAVMPVLLHVALFAPSGAAPWRLGLCSMGMAVACWIPAVRALLVRHPAGDRTTYQLFILSYAAALLAGPILWWG